VAGGIALVPFDAVIGNRDARAVGDMRTAERGIVARVGNDGDVLVALDLEHIAPIGVGLSAARKRRQVRDHQAVEPFADLGILILPLPEIARARQRHNPIEHEEETAGYGDAAPEDR